MAVVVAASLLILAAGVYLVIPRLAHRAFEHGDFGRAALLYRIARRFALRAETRGAFDVSLAGCRLARSDWQGALGQLDRVDRAALGASARAAWHNNRAYAQARAAADPHAALQDADEAVRLRPDVPGFRHTRAVALIALGRLDDAILELEDVWHKLEEEAPPLLEAERCYDLGLAWQKKGEPEYARDYFQRAMTVAPGSAWAALAATQVSSPAPAAAAR